MRPLYETPSICMDDITIALSIKSKRAILSFLFTSFNLLQPPTYLLFNPISSSFSFAALHFSHNYNLFLLIAHMPAYTRIFSVVDSFFTIFLLSRPLILPLCFYSSHLSSYPLSVFIIIFPLAPPLAPSHSPHTLLTTPWLRWSYLSGK